MNFPKEGPGTVLLRSVAVALCLSMLAACAGQNTSTPTMPHASSFLHKISDDPTLPETRAYLATHPLNLRFPVGRDCSEPEIKGGAPVRPAFCDDTPAAPPDMSWDYGFMFGTGMVSVSFGPYIGRVPGSGVMPCVGQTAHQLVADATAMAAALANTYNSWSSDANAAQIEELIGAYAAGEIGALAFIAGVVSLDAVAAAIAVAAIGLTLWSLLEISACIANGGPTSYLPNPRTRIMHVAFRSDLLDSRLRLPARVRLHGKRIS